MNLSEALRATVFEDADILLERMHLPNDHLLCRPMKRKERKSEGGIITVDMEKAGGRQTRRSEVIAVGPGRMLESGQRVTMDIVPGDVVYHGEFVGFFLSTDDAVELLVMGEKDVMAVHRAQG